MARQLILVTVMFRIAALALGQPTDTNTITTTTKSSPVITKFVTSYIDPTRRHCLEEVYRFWLKVPLDDKLKALVKDVRLHYEDTKTTVVDDGVSKSALKSCKTLHHTLTEEFRVKVPCWFDAREGLGLDETRTLMDVVHKIAKTKEARQHIKYVHEAHYACQYGYDAGIKMRENNVYNIFSDWRKEVEISESRQQCLEKAIKFWKSLRPLTIDEHIKVLVRDARKNYRLLYLVGDEKRDESDSCKKLRAEAETSSKETVSCLYNRQIVGDPRKAWYDMLEQSIEVRLVKEALFVCDLDGATETDEVKLYYDAVKPYELDELEKLY